MRRSNLAFCCFLILMSSSVLRADDPSTFPLFDDAVRAMCVSPDGKTVAFGSDSGEIAIWDLTAEKVIRKWKGHEDGIRGLAYSPDASLLYSGAYDKNLCLWNAKSGEQVRKTASIGIVEDVCVSPDGKLVAVSFEEGDAVQIFGADIAKETHRLKLPFEAPLEGSSARSALAFSTDGTLLAATAGGRGWPEFKGGDSTISIWDVKDWHLRASFPGDRFTMYDVEFSPDGKQLAGATNRGKTVKLWDVPERLVSDEIPPAMIADLVGKLDSDDFKERESAQKELTEIGLAARDALEEATKNGSTELKFRANAVLKKLKRADIGPARVLPRSTFDTHALAFSPDGNWLASGRQFDKPGNVILYGLGEAQRTMVAPHQHGAWVVAFSLDGEQLITGERDGQITIWSIPKD